jgi:hypothetical protein
MEDLMRVYHQIYRELCLNPFASSKEIGEKVQIPARDIEKHLKDMHESRILTGPLISLKPTKEYRPHAYFLKVDEPLQWYKEVTGPWVTKCMGYSDWNILVVMEKEVDWTGYKGVRACVHQGVKGATHITQASNLEWRKAVTQIYEEMVTPTEKTTLYEEGSHLNWGEQEWALYHTLRFNARTHYDRTDCKVKPEQYNRWISHLTDVALIQPAFYPHGLDNYGILDFLLTSEYQRQIRDVLGLLPASGGFFSMGEQLLARIFFNGKNQWHLVYAIISALERHHYFTESLETLTLFPADNDTTGK